MADLIAMTEGYTLKLYASNGDESVDLVATLRMRMIEPRAVVSVVNGLRPYLDLTPEAAIPTKAIAAKSAERPKRVTDPELAAWRTMGRKTRRLPNGRLMSGWAVSVLAVLASHPNEWLTSKQIAAEMGATTDQWRTHASVVQRMRREGFIRITGQRAGVRYQLNLGAEQSGGGGDGGDGETTEPSSEASG